MKWRALLLSGVLVLGACGGGGGSGAPGQGSAPGDDPAGRSCDGFCADAGAPIFLTQADVKRILAQAVHQADALGAEQVTVAVVDRVGNVLAIHQKGGGQILRVTTDDPNEVRAALDGLTIPAEFSPDTLAALAKAITGAYLSSEGNAFTTRTANQIVQEHFNPGERNQPSGPLFGVQFSQLACSDFMMRATGNGVSVGPHRSPLGMSADPGGLPLYKDGTVVGGIGVLSDGLYSVDKNILNNDRDNDEMIAVAGSFGFAAPKPRRADRITVEGKTFRYADVDFDNLPVSPEDAPAYENVGGMLVGVNGYYTVTGDDDADILAGTAFTTPASGVRAVQAGDYPAQDVADFQELQAFTFVDQNNAVRFPPIDGTDAAQLAQNGGAAPISAEEVTQLMKNALGVALRGRAQIRTPQGTPIRVTISIVDSQGTILGMMRTRDGPIFGSDVSLQKARTAAFFSSTDAADVLRSIDDLTFIPRLEVEGLPPLGPVPNLQYIEIDPELVPPGLPVLRTYSTPVFFADYVTAAKEFIGPTALEDGVAFADRSGGNLSRPFYPDGIRNTANGPFSKPFELADPGSVEWSVFSSGLQLDLVLGRVLQHALFSLGDPRVPDVGDNCIGVEAEAPRRINNGIQIFPGSVPIFRGDQLVGAIGISGDGIDQDDMISFLGLHEAGLALTEARQAEVDAGTYTPIGNAPKDMRADQLQPKGERLRYIQCPQTPFIGSSENFVCDGK